MDDAPHDGGTTGSNRCRPRRCEKAGDPDRFYCPFPGCNRSFIDLWRLKVHYRAASDVRGSGRERGHGLELPACPKCGKVLERGRHHVNCAAGKAAPSQASRRADKGGDERRVSGTKRKALWQAEREMPGVLAPGGDLQISVDSAVHAQAPTSVLCSRRLGVPAATSPHATVVSSTDEHCIGKNSGLKPSLASRRPCRLTIPMETPHFEGQPDSLESMFSTDTRVGLSPIPVALSSQCVPSSPVSGGTALGQQIVHTPTSQSVNVVAMPAQSITPRGPGPLNLADCQVTQGYAVFVEGEEAQYDVFFVPGEGQDPGSLPLNLQQNLEKK